MLETIIKAIHDREELSLAYYSLVRIVEPHAVGVSITGSNVLWCFQTQVRPAAKPTMFIPPTLCYDWELLELSQISSLRPAGRHFANERFGYKRSNKHMVTIFAEL